MTTENAAAGACWACGAAAPAGQVAIETVIRGRPRGEGGPYRVFRCPACRVENGVLANPAGAALLLFPLSGLEEPSVFDRFLSDRERLRLAKARSWWAENRARVERFRRGEPEPSARRRPAEAARPRPPRPPPPTGPRAVLGVAADAPPDEIRRAFRRLAKRHHPDRDPSPEAAARFRAVRAAYEELLRDLGV